MKFTKTVKSERVKLVGMEIEICDPRNPRYESEKFLFCKEGKHYLLCIEKCLIKPYLYKMTRAEFCVVGVCAGKCVHENTLMPMHIPDVLDAISMGKLNCFGEKNIATLWDVERHNRIVCRLGR